MAYDSLRLAENIALLQELWSTPLPPTRNELDGAKNDDHRTFDLRQELEIVECLTYLSAYSDDPDRVMALCLEEKKDNSLVVSFATNTGSTSHLSEGIQGIIAVLMRKANSPDNECLIALLTSVLTHARPRAVRRLGFRNTPGLSKRLQNSTATRLEKAISYSNGQPSTGFIKLAREFSRLSNDFADSPSGTAGTEPNSILISILETAAEMRKSCRTELQNILGGVPTNVMCADMKEQLESRLGHLGHYIPTAKKLLSYAKKYSIFRSITTRAVFIPPPVLSIPKSYPKFQHHRKLLDSVHLGIGQSGGPGSRDAHPSVKDSIAVWNNEVQRQVKQYQSSGAYKVHAEIQLLFDYENRPNVKYHPRVLKSSKDACFLCDLFIKTHGKFFIPRTHGRVYDRWILPPIPRSGARRDQYTWAVKTFNEAVEALLMEAVKKKDERKRLTYPRESGIFSLASTSTKSSNASGSASSKLSDGISSDPSTPRPSPVPSVLEDLEDLETPASGLDAPTSPVKLRASDPLAPPESPTIQPTTPPVALPTPATPPPPPSPPQVIALKHGIPHFHTFSPNGPTTRFHTPRIHIKLSRHHLSNTASRKPLHSFQETRDIRLEILWLPMLETTDAQTEDQESFTADFDKDWESLQPREGVLFSETGLMFTKKSEVVRLKAVGQE